MPLPTQAMALLPPRVKGVEGWVFGPLGYVTWTRFKPRLDATLGLPHWTVHDLRRTVVTGMAEIGIAPHIIEAIVNHVSGHKGGVAGVYNRAKYSQEKRAALQRWADHVERIVTGTQSATVVEFESARR